MSGLFDLVTDTLQGKTDAVATGIGTDPSTARNAMAAALPVLVGALTRNAAKPGGADALHAALERDHDGSVLQNPDQVIQNPEAFSGAGILGHLLGDRKAEVATQLGGHTGLDAAQVEKLLTMLAPIVLGGLGKLRREQNHDGPGLASMLHGEAGALRARAPELGGLLGALDANHDGSVLDEAAKAVGSLFKR